MSELIDLRGMFTWIFDCVTTKIGAVNEADVRTLESNRFDEAPVLDSSGAVIGVVGTEYLRSKVQESEALLRDDAHIKFSAVHFLVELDELLSKLELHRSVLVSRSETEFVGLFTISDLNSHRFRTTLYPQFAQLEADLAAAIEAEFSDAWTWLKWLGDGAIGVVGHWEVLKRNGMDLGATSGAHLSQLLIVVENYEELRRQLGFDSKTACNDFRRSAAVVRNAVMHPARPLIESHDRVRSLRQVASSVSRVCGALKIREQIRSFESRSRERNLLSVPPAPGAL